MEFEKIVSTLGEDAAKVAQVITAIESLQKYSQFKSVADVEKAVESLQKIINYETDKATQNAVDTQKSTETVAEANKA